MKKSKSLQESYTGMRNEIARYGIKQKLLISKKLVPKKTYFWGTLCVLHIWKGLFNKSEVVSIYNEHLKVSLFKLKFGGTYSVF